MTSPELKAAFQFCSCCSTVPWTCISWESCVNGWSPRSLSRAQGIPILRVTLLLCSGRGWSWRTLSCRQAEEENFWDSSWPFAWRATLMRRGDNILYETSRRGSVSTDCCGGNWRASLSPWSQLENSTLDSPPLFFSHIQTPILKCFGKITSAHSPGFRPRLLNLTLKFHNWKTRYCNILWVLSLTQKKTRDDREKTILRPKPSLSAGGNKNFRTPNNKYTYEKHIFRRKNDFWEQRRRVQATWG